MTVLGIVLGALAVSTAAALFVARFMRVGAGPQKPICPDDGQPCDYCRTGCSLTA